MATSKSLADEQFHALWQALPDHPVTEGVACEIFERTARKEGDGAWSGATLLSLEILGIVTKSNGAYARAAKFPELIEDGANREGSDVFNEALERQQVEERRKNAKRDEEAAENYRKSAAYRERQEILAIVAEGVREAVAPLEARIERLEDEALRRNLTVAA